jgi:uncharacterized protein (TIGR04255 family)
MSFQIGVGPPPTRYWFLNPDGTELVQVQADRLVVNWRQLGTGAEYPRYDAMRELFRLRLEDLARFIEEGGFGALDIVQAELDYINAVDVEPRHEGELNRLLDGWNVAARHHLGTPEQARAGLVFRVPDIGSGPVRMHVAIDPAQKNDGSPMLFLTLTVRGAPADTGVGATMSFLDCSHEHVVRSFEELTTPDIHSRWGLTQRDPA